MNAKKLKTFTGYYVCVLCLLNAVIFSVLYDSILSFKNLFFQLIFILKTIVGRLLVFHVRSPHYTRTTKIEIDEKKRKAGEKVFHKLITNFTPVWR